MIWWLVILKFLIGCGLLAWGADRFIVASSVVARRFGMSSLMVGMLLVGFGTSFPEIVVSGIAAFHGTPLLAVGNAIGSNIINTGMVIGVAALLFPLTLSSRIITKEFPLLFLYCIIVGALLWNGYLSRLDGIVLVILLVLYLLWLFFMSRRSAAKEDVITEEYRAELAKPSMSMLVAVVWWFVGLGLLFLSSELIVSGAVSIAKWLQVSDLIIGLTIVAIGTSLPELAATIISALRKEPDIAIGNVVGSNIFNLVAVMATPALISPTALPKAFIYRDYPLMVGFILVMWLLAFLPPRRRILGRISGLILFLGFIGYLVLMVYSAA